MQSVETAQISTFETYHPELRKPLRDALNIVADIVNLFDWEAETTPFPKESGFRSSTVLSDILSKVQEQHGTCVDFEREFVSVALSIATGVGKTRLMGAIMTHLYLTGKSKNFFVLAPNLTIYDKLIQDFGHPEYKKYAFRGIAELANTPPEIITGDNYAQPQGLFKDVMRINIFNISKFNKDSDTGKKTGAPRLKRPSEYLGQSYWNYLVGVKDLVILMDEAHRYHADKSKKVINELKPKFGVELTATPFVPKNGNAVADKETDKGTTFKNIVYEYSLAAALADGKYIKDPAIATRQNFDKRDKTEDEIERIKLEDAVSVHEKTKVELQRYALQSGRKLVKPFMLVVCKDTTHARSVYDYVTSKKFYDGNYASKALQIDSTTRTTEDIEKQFVALENPNSPIEIVIHVNMLKEGWDVSNLYTIVPLRAARALTLIEQTIGRGLRLPYGERVNDEHVDKLTLISHEHFDQVIAASKDPNSIFQKMKFIELDPSVVNGKQELVTIADRLTTKVQAEQARIETIKDEGQKQRAIYTNDAHIALINILPMVAAELPQVKNIQDLATPEAKIVAMKLLKQDLDNRPQTLFKTYDNELLLSSAEEVYHKVVKDFTENIIEIPRLVISTAPPEAHFEDFDLDTTGTNGVETKFETHVFDAQIVRETLVANKRDYIGLLRGANEKNADTPEQKIIADLLLFAEINYDKNKALLMKLAKQATTAIRQTLRSDETLEMVVKENLKVIVTKIYVQMKSHFSLKQTGYLKSDILPFRAIEKWRVTVPMSVGRTHYGHKVEPKGRVPKLVFAGFQKSCHAEYTFDSSSELELACVLERDKDVEKWLRPASNQFDIYWDNQSRRYEPDFVVETKSKIYMVEVKASNELKNEDVKAKAKAARTYCDTISEYLKEHGKKAWVYVILPHDHITSTSTFQYLVDKN